MSEIKIRYARDFVSFCEILSEFYIGDKSRYMDFMGSKTFLLVYAHRLEEFGEDSTIKMEWDGCKVSYSKDTSLAPRTLYEGGVPALEKDIKIKLQYNPEERCLKVSADNLNVTIDIDKKMVVGINTKG
jgi:hypothetical protein